MQIRKEQNNEQTMTISLIGRLDTTSSKEFDAEMQTINSDVHLLILNFKELSYISSAGLRVLLTAQKTANARNSTMKLINVNDEIMQVFELTGFQNFLTIE